MYKSLYSRAYAETSAPSTISALLNEQFKAFLSDGGDRCSTCHLFSVTFDLGASDRLQLGSQRVQGSWSESAVMSPCSHMMLDAMVEYLPDCACRGSRYTCCKHHSEWDIISSAL